MINNFLQIFKKIYVEWKIIHDKIIVLFQVAVSYNPYSYTARFAPSNAASYASMGDVDWGKRRYKFENI